MIIVLWNILVQKKRLQIGVILSKTYQNELLMNSMIWLVKICWLDKKKLEILGSRLKHQNLTQTIVRPQQDWSL